MNNAHFDQTANIDQQQVNHPIQQALQDQRPQQQEDASRENDDDDEVDLQIRQIQVQHHQHQHQNAQNQDELDENHLIILGFLIGTYIFVRTIFNLANFLYSNSRCSVLKNYN